MIGYLTKVNAQWGGIGRHLGVHRVQKGTHRYTGSTGVHRVHKGKQGTHGYTGAAMGTLV